MFFVAIINHADDPSLNSIGAKDGGRVSLGNTKSVTHFMSKKSEYMGQFRVTPEEKIRIREMLRFYERDRGAMARSVMEALFYHHAHGEHLVFPLRFVINPR